MRRLTPRDRSRARRCACTSSTQSHISFGVAVITQLRWLFVLAGATPATWGDPVLCDETLEPFDFSRRVARRRRRHRHPHGQCPPRLRGGTGRTRARRTRRLRRHPRDAVPRRGARARRRPRRRQGRRRYHLGQGRPGLRRRHATARLRGGTHRRRLQFKPARWDLLPEERYMWAIGADRARLPEALLVLLGLAHRRPAAAAARRSTPSSGEIVELRRRGFRFIALADDNFYPVPLADLAHGRGGGQNPDAPARVTGGPPRRAVRADGSRSPQLPGDMVFFTQITMEAAEDPEFLDAMRKRAHQGRAGRRRVGDARGPQGRLQGLQSLRRGSGRAAARVLGSTASTCSARSSSACRATGASTFDATAALAAARRRHLRAVRDADAVPGHASISRSGNGPSRRTGTRSPASADPSLADPAGEPPEGLLAASDDDAGRDSQVHPGRVGSASTRFLDLGALARRQVLAGGVSLSC